MKQPQRPALAQLRTSTPAMASPAAPSLPATPARSCGGYRYVSFECLRVHKRPAAPVPAPSPFATKAQVPLPAAHKPAPLGRTPDSSAALDFAVAISRYAEHQGMATPPPFSAHWTSAENSSLMARMSSLAPM